MIWVCIVGVHQHLLDGQNIGKVSFFKYNLLLLLFFLILGLQIYSSPFDYNPADPDMVAVQRESRSRLEFVDILYAGYDGYV